jgi:exopolysaccharide biosynthesis polyprenyl glycosylphosphotransferase
MKKVELIFSVLLLPCDFLLLVLAGLTAYSVRFNENIGQLPPAIFTIPKEQYVTLVILTALAWMLIFWWNGLYRIDGNRRIVDELRKVFVSCATGVLAIIVLLFFNRDLFSSRFIILSAFGFALLYIMTARVVIIFIERALFKKGIGLTQLAIIGNGHITDIVTGEFIQKPTLGYAVAAQYTEFSRDTEEALHVLVQQRRIEEILLTDSTADSTMIEKMVDFCDEYHLVFKYAASISETPVGTISISPIGGIPIVEVKKTPLEGWGRVLKRLFDVVGSFALIILTSPIMALTALAIVVESGMPIFFSRKDDGTVVKRIGQYGKPFTYFKFRSMKQNTDSLRYDEAMQEKNVRKGTPMVKIVDDPRVTKVGQWIRRFSLDELPEFFLVLKGDMSLVGPRPHLPEEVAQYQKHHKRVLHMKPGITGLAQVTGRSDLDFEDEVRLDTYYMEHWALWLDIVIVLKTPLAMIKKRNTL